MPGCTPVVNLFATRVKPLQDQRQPARYTVRPDAQHPRGAEVYAIDRVLCGSGQPWPDEPLQAIPPVLSWAYPGSGRGWVPRHDLGPEAGDAAVIEIVGPDGEPAPLPDGGLTVDVTATNADLPRELPIGHPGGDLVPDGGGEPCTVRLLQPATPARRFDRRGERAWHLISTLKPNALWLSAAGIEAVRELLRLHDLPRSADSERLVQSLVAIEARPAQAWIGHPMPSLARGTEVRLSIDEQRLAGTGLRLFAQVLERFFPRVVHRNSFTRLELISAQDARVLYRGGVRTGEIPLL